MIECDNCDQQTESFHAGAASGWGSRPPRPGERGPCYYCLRCAAAQRRLRRETSLVLAAVGALAAFRACVDMSCDRDGEADAGLADAWTTLDAAVVEYRVEP